MLNELLSMLPVLRDLMAQDIWTYQRVNEPQFTFDRAWTERGEHEPKRRILLHSMGVNLEPFWHEHTQPCAFLILGPGPYEVSFSSTTSRPLSRVLTQGVFGYEMSGHDSWHAVRTYGPCISIGLVGDAARYETASAVSLPDAVSAAALSWDIIVCIDRIRKGHQLP